MFTKDNTFKRLLFATRKENCKNYILNMLIINWSAYYYQKLGSEMANQCLFNINRKFNLIRYKIL